MTRGAVNLGIVSKFDNKGVSKARKAFKKFGGVAAGVATGAVAAIGGIATAAARMSSDLEQSFAKIEGLVGVSTEEIGKLEQAAIELGPQFGKSAQEAADALFFITSAGLRGAEATDVLEASLKASAAGLGEVEPIANAATAAMNTYGSETLSGSEAVDALTEAVRLGQLAPAELSGALGKVIPIAKELGVSFEETTGLVAGLTRGGLSASEAVTGVRGAMQAVLKPTGEAADMLEQYGSSTGEVRSMIEDDGLLATFGHLREMFAGNEEDFTRLIGSQEGLNAVLAMTGEASEEYTDIVSQMTDEVSVLDDAFGAVEETAGFKFERAMETAKAALLPVGDTLLEIGAQMLDNLMPTIELLAPLFEETFSHLEEPLGELAGLLPTLIEAFMPLLPIIGQLAGIMVQLAVDLMPIFVQLMELLVPILELIMPVLEIIVGLFDLLLIPIEMLLGFLTPLIETILPPLTEAFGLLSGAIEFLDEVFSPIVNTLLPVFGDVVETTLGPIIDHFETQLGSLVDNGFQYLIDSGILPAGFSLETLADEGKKQSFRYANFIITAFNGVVKAVNYVVASFVEMNNTLLEGLQGFGLYTDLPTLDFTPIATIPEVEPFDFMKFEEVDVSGMGTGGEESRFASQIEQAQANAEATSLLPGNFRGSQVPRMAEGGIVDRQTLAIIGEAGPEAVIPLDQLDQGGSTYNITVNAGMGTNGPQVGEEIVAAIKRYERSSGRVFQSA